MPGGRLTIRADASIGMGTGHVMRCLALAQGWQDRGGDVVFAMAESTPAIDQYLRSQNVEFVKLTCVPGSDCDATELAKAAGTCPEDWIVIDGYHFDSNYQRVLKNAGLKALFVDDAGKNAPYSADIILNQNITASEDNYSQREARTRLLLGTDFVMLRRRFDRWHGWRRSFPPVAKKILVTMGGSDPDAVTLPVIKALADICAAGMQLTVMVGGAILDWQS